MARSPKALAAGQSLQGFFDHLGYTAQKSQPLIEVLMDAVEQSDRIAGNVVLIGQNAAVGGLEGEP